MVYPRHNNLKKLAKKVIIKVITGNNYSGINMLNTLKRRVLG